LEKPEPEAGRVSEFMVAAGIEPHASFSKTPVAAVHFGIG
jgi:hypothetical protein